MSSVSDDYEPDVNVLIVAGLNPNSPVVPVAVQSFLSYLADTPNFDSGFVGVDFDHDYAEHFPEHVREFVKTVWEALAEDYIAFIVRTVVTGQDFENE